MSTVITGCRSSSGVPRVKLPAAASGSARADRGREEAVEDRGASSGGAARYSRPHGEKKHMRLWKLISATQKNSALVNHNYGIKSKV